MALERFALSFPSVRYPKRKSWITPPFCNLKSPSSANCCAPSAEGTWARAGTATNVIRMRKAQGGSRVFMTRILADRVSPRRQGRTPTERHLQAPQRQPPFLHQRLRCMLDFLDDKKLFPKIWMRRVFLVKIC